MNPKSENNMEEVLIKIRYEFGMQTMANGKMLISVFNDISQVKQDQRLIRYLVESGCHTDLLGARELSLAMQQARLQQTVKKLCAETLISEEAALRVCTAFWNAILGSYQIRITETEIPIQSVQDTSVPEPVCAVEPTAEVLQKPQPQQSVARESEERESEEREEKKQTSIFVPMAVLTMFMLTLMIICIGLFGDTSSGKENAHTAATEATPEQVSLSEYIQRTQSENGSRVLQEDPMQYNLDENGYLKTFPVFGTDLMRDQVASVTFLDTLADAPEKVVDLSAARDGSVLSWIVPNGNLFDLYIAAEGGVKAPANSSGLFAYYSNATSISFNNSFDTSGAVYLDQMFYGCSSLKNVDLGGMDTGSTELMSFFFSGCASLTTVDVSHFDTSNVRDFAFMFSDCTALTSLDVRNFDTSKAEDMAGMFSSCWFLQELDLSGFHTGNVTDMSFMFSNCVKLAELNISSFDTSSVTDMRYMFYSTEKLQNLNLSGFDVSQVTKYDNFMKSGAKINGRSWEKFFRN